MVTVVCSFFSHKYHQTADYFRLFIPLLCTQNATTIIAHHIAFLPQPKIVQFSFKKEKREEQMLWCPASLDSLWYMSVLNSMALNF